MDLSEVSNSFFVHHIQVVHMVNQYIEQLVNKENEWLQWCNDAAISLVLWQGVFLWMIKKFWYVLTYQEKPCVKEY